MPTNGQAGSAVEQPRGSVRAMRVGKADAQTKRRYLESIGGAEAVFGADDRTPVDQSDRFPFAAICCLRTALGARDDELGTGWLVGPRTVITAGHCIKYEQYSAQEILVIPGRDGNERPFGVLRSRHFSVCPGWDGTSATKDRDIGCIHLDEPVGSKTGWFEIGTLSNQDLQDLMVNICGYASDLASGTRQYFDDNIVEGVRPDRLYYLVDTMAGQSGSPVWAYPTSDAPPTVVGVHTWGKDVFPGGVRVANSATRLTEEFTTLIRGWIAEDDSGSNLPPPPPEEDNELEAIKVADEDGQIIKVGIEKKRAILLNLGKEVANELKYIMCVAKE